MTHLRLTQETVHVLEGLFTIGVCCLCNLHNVQLDQDNFSLDLFVNLHLFGKSISPCQGSLPHLTCQFHNTAAISLQTCFCFLSLNIVVVDGGRPGQNGRRVLTWGVSIDPSLHSILALFLKFEGVRTKLGLLMALSWAHGNCRHT